MTIRVARTEGSSIFLKWPTCGGGWCTNDANRSFNILHLRTENFDEDVSDPSVRTWGKEKLITCNFQLMFPNMTLFRVKSDIQYQRFYCAPQNPFVTLMQLVTASSMRSLETAPNHWPANMQDVHLMKIFFVFRERWITHSIHEQIRKKVGQLQQDVKSFMKKCSDAQRKRSMVIVYGTEASVPKGNTGYLQTGKLTGLKSMFPSIFSDYFLRRVLEQFFATFCASAFDRNFCAAKVSEKTCSEILKKVRYEVMSIFFFSWGKVEKHLPFHKLAERSTERLDMIFLLRYHGENGEIVVASFLQIILTVSLAAHRLRTSMLRLVAQMCQTRMGMISGKISEACSGSPRLHYQVARGKCLKKAREQ